MSQYFGKPCARGHSGLRYSNGLCVQCSKDRDKARRNAEPERTRQVVAIVLVDGRAAVTWIGHEGVDRHEITCRPGLLGQVAALRELADFIETGEQRLERRVHGRDGE